MNTSQQANMTRSCMDIRILLAPLPVPLLPCLYLGESVWLTLACLQLLCDTPPLLRQMGQLFVEVTFICLFTSVQRRAAWQAWRVHLQDSHAISWCDVMISSDGRVLHFHSKKKPSVQERDRSVHWRSTTFSAQSTLFTHNMTHHSRRPSSAP